MKKTPPKTTPRRSFRLQQHCHQGIRWAFSMCQVIWMPVTRYPGQCCLSRDCLAIRNMGKTIGIPVCYAILMRCPLGAIMNPELVISRGFFFVMADGQLESVWSQLYYATRTLSPVRLVLKVTLFLLLYCKLYRGVSLFLGSINWTRLD